MTRKRETETCRRKVPYARATEAEDLVRGLQVRNLQIRTRDLSRLNVYRCPVPLLDGTIHYHIGNRKGDEHRPRLAKREERRRRKALIDAYYERQEAFAQRRVRT